MAGFGIGQAVRRNEDYRFLTGSGRYVADLNLPRQCHGVQVVSPHAHARIKSIDVDAARTAPGVACVLTGADAPGDGIGGIPPFFLPVAWGGPDAYSTERPLLLSDVVRCVGDRVAFVVAETEAQAQAAAELVTVEYEPLPAVVDVEAAVAPDAPRVWGDCPGGNVAVRIAMGDKNAADAAFSRASHVIELRLENNRVAPNSLEPRCSIGDYNAFSDTYTLYASAQGPHVLRTTLAESVLGVPETKIRVVCPDVGGGFGMKSNLYPEDALTLWASRRCGRPVKWTGTRSEALLLDTHGRDQVVQAALALDEEGRILAVRAHANHALGSYFWGAATAPLFFSLMFVPSVYDIQTIDLGTNAVFTHTAPTSVYRGAGRPEAIYLIERLIERAAREIGIEPDEIRRRNMISPDALPYETPTHHHYDSGVFAELMDRCMALADWAGFQARRVESERQGRLRGRAVTPYIELGGVFNERMELRFDPGGNVTIVAGTHSHGQGHETAFAQLVSEWLGVPFASIRFVQGDTDQVSFGRGTFAARSSMVGGAALRAAADAIIAKGKQMAAALMEVSAEDIEFDNGNFTVSGTDKSMGIVEVAKMFYAPAGPVIEFGLGLEAAGSYSGVPGGAPNYPNGCQVCEVEVDPETGSVHIDRLAAVDDLGLIINPMICEGQIQGGIAQGLGQALTEKVVYDGTSGQLLTGGLLDYCLPRADDLPTVASELVEIPAKTNPLGVKGIGESGTIGAPPTIVNAILDALAPLGVTDIQMPATSQSVWRAIQAAKSAA